MNQTVNHVVLGLSTGLTVFATIVPLIHVVAELAVFAGVQIGPWDNPVEVFIFLMTAAILGVFPWGLWITLTDARKLNLFNEDREVAEYVIAAMVVYLGATLLVCTRLQSSYAEYRWFATPALWVCAAALVYWRWNRVWQFPTRIGIRSILDHALAKERTP